MRHRRASILGATLAVSALAMASPVSPASADTNVCVGQGVAVTGPLVYPTTVTTTTAPSAIVTVQAPRTVGFAFNIVLGTCAPDFGKGLAATGALSGWCGHSSGTGVTAQGHRFALLGAGSFLLLTGGVTGVVNTFHDLLIAHNDCLDGATNWFVTGVLLLTHCPTVENRISLTIPIPVTLSTTTVAGLTVSIHTGPTSVHNDTCA